MIWNDFWKLIEEALQGDYPVTHDHTQQEPATETLPTKPTSMPTQTKAEQLYTLSKSLIGQHLTLNEAVPWMVGCAEAVSALLQRFNTAGIPPKGIEGTAALASFLASSKQFQEIYTYTPGAVIVSATGSGNGKVRGHTGVCGHNSIMSNNSETGRWDTQWSIERWTGYFGSYGQIPTRYFLPV